MPIVNVLEERKITNLYVGIPFPESITLDKNSITLTTVGQTEQLTATLSPTPCDQSITWSSDDTTIATVSTSGLVTCVAPGTCTITATTANGLTATCGVTDQQGWQPGANTMLYYTLDGDALDHSGNNYDGTWQGTANYATLSSGLQVADFTGSGSPLSYITCDSFTSSPKTVCFWLRFADFSSSGGQDWRQIIGQYASEAGMWQLRYHTSGVRVMNGTNKNVTLDTNWHHIGILLDSSTFTLYLDGVQQSQLTSTTVTASGGLKIGGNTFGDNGRLSRWMRGFMSNIIIESVVWTAQEIEDYYNQTKSLYGIS